MGPRKLNDQGQPLCKWGHVVAGDNAMPFRGHTVRCVQCNRDISKRYSKRVRAEGFSRKALEEVRLGRPVKGDIGRVDASVYAKLQG